MDPTAVLNGVKVLVVAPVIGLLKSVVSQVKPEYHWYVGTPTPFIWSTSKSVVAPSKQTVWVANGSILIVGP